MDATQPGSLADVEATISSQYAVSGSQEQGLEWLQPGQEIEEFVVQRILGRGAMGVVVLAHDRELDRPVAIKLLANAQSEVANARLLREAQSAARLSHPNVVAVHQVGTFQGQIYLVMECVDGGNLRDWVQQEKRHWTQVLDAYVQAGRGLAAAHAAGFVHRDFKPDNVLIGKHGRVRVTDFGLVAPASTVSGPAGPLAAAQNVASFDRLTQSGAVLGTPAYMAPEQFGLAEVDPRADQFSFCVSLFEALFGRRPFEGATAANLYLAVEQGRVNEVALGPVPPSIHATILRGLSFDPAKRWPSMEHLLTALTARPAAQGPGPATVGLAILASVVVLGGAGSLAYVSLADDDVVQATDTVTVSNEGPCPPSPLIGKAWNDEQRQGVRQKLERSKRADPKAYAVTIESRLDTYAERWAQAHREACEATRIRREQPEDAMALRHECLRKSAVEAESLVRFLTEAGDTRVIEAAPSILDVLPRLERCATVDLLKNEASVQPSADLDDKLRRFASVGGLIRAGLEQSAKPTVDTLLAELQGGDDPRLLARAWLRKAEVEFSLGDSTAASEAVRQAIDTATKARAVDLESAARTLALNLGAYDASAQTTGEALLRDARDAAGRARDDLALARMHIASGVLYATTQRPNEAETEYGRALGLLEGSGARAFSDRVNALVSRAALRTQQAKVDEALIEYERAIALIEEGMGSEHPMMAAALIGKAAALGSTQDPGRARDVYAQAREIWARAYGPDHPPLALVDHHLAMIEQALGNLDTALEHYDRAIALQLKTQKGPDLNHALLLDQYGMALFMKGRFDEADQKFVRAREIYVDNYGDNDPRVANVDFHRAAVAASAGDFDRGIELFEHVLEIQETAFGPLNFALVYTLTELGDVQLLADDCGAAAPRYQRALLIRQSVGMQFDDNAARILVGQAQCDLVRGEVEEARTKIQESLSGIDPSRLNAGVMARVHLVQAQLAQHDGDDPKAQTHIEAARSLIRDNALESWSIGAHVRQWIESRLSGEQQTIRLKAAPFPQQQQAKTEPAAKE